MGYGEVEDSGKERSRCFRAHGWAFLRLFPAVRACYAPNHTPKCEVADWRQGLGSACKVPGNGDPPQTSESGLPLQRHVFHLPRNPLVCRTLWLIREPPWQIAWLSRAVPRLCVGTCGRAPSCRKHATRSILWLPLPAATPMEWQVPNSTASPAAHSRSARPLDRETFAPPANRVELPANDGLCTKASPRTPSPSEKAGPRDRLTPGVSLSTAPPRKSPAGSGLPPWVKSSFTTPRLQVRPVHHKELIPQHRAWPRHQLTKKLFATSQPSRGSWFFKNLDASHTATSRKSATKQRKST